MNVKQACGAFFLFLAGVLSAMFAVFYIRNREWHGEDHPGAMESDKDIGTAIQADCGKLDGAIDGAIDSAGKIESGIANVEAGVGKIQGSIDIIKGTSGELDRINSDFDRIIAEVEEQNGMARK